MIRVFVSGCYDILHAGHIQFFEDARALGDHLTVCFASKDVLMLAKKRPSSLPDDNKALILGSIKFIDTVVTSSDLHPILDFAGHFKKQKPDILAVTEDDKNVDAKRAFCEKHSVKLVVLPKRNLLQRTSTTDILARIKNVHEVPLRVDFAGGWLDVPAFSKKGAYVVNCTISPMVSLKKWPYEKGAGLGGSAAHALLQIKDGVASELDLGVGWQDPAVIIETGLCIWRSGRKPILNAKFNPDWLSGKMLILWTGSGHVTPDHVKEKRDFNLIKKAGETAAKAVAAADIKGLARAIGMSYKAQLGEGMEQLPRLPKSLAHKYLGGGHGGYALYLFASQKNRDAAAKKTKAAKSIEPYIEDVVLGKK